MSRDRRNKEGPFLTPADTHCQTMGIAGKVTVGGYAKNGRPIAALDPPLTPTTDRENEGVNTTPPPRGR